MLSVNGRCFTFDMSADARNSLWIRNRGWHTGTYRDHSGYPRHGGFLNHVATSYQLPLVTFTYNYGKIHHFQWENPLFLWSFFNSYVTNYQRVSSNHPFIDGIFPWNQPAGIRGSGDPPLGWPRLPAAQDGFERGEGSSCFLARSEESVPRDALATVIGACLNQDGRLGPETFTGNMRNLMCPQWWWC